MNKSISAAQHALICMYDQPRMCVVLNMTHIKNKKKNITYTGSI